MKKLLPVLPVTASAQELIALAGLEMTPRWLNQLAADGHIPKAIRGRYDVRDSVRGIIRYYRSTGSSLASQKAAVASEQHRKLKAANDAREGLTLLRSDVVNEFRKVAPVIKSILLRLEGEYPLAVAGLDVPQARIYGKRLNDEVLSEFQKAFHALGI